MGRIMPMDMESFRRVPHLSASSINDYRDCSLRYRFGRIDHLKPPFRSDSLEFGSTIHKALADFHQMRMTGEDPSLEDLQGFFEHYWHESADGTEIRYKDGNSFDSILKEGLALLAVYHEELPRDDFRVVAIEEPFRFQLPGLPVPLIGIFDLVEEDESGTIIIVDWKTTSKAYSTEDIDENLQLTLYQMAAKANGYEDRRILSRFDCLIKTKKPKFQQYYTTRSISDEARVSKIAQSVWDGIDKKIFIPAKSGWKCKGCEFKTACDDWGIESP